MNTPRLPPKKDVAIALLQKSSVYIHLDPRHEGVRVPPWLKQRVPLVLQVGLNMAVRIPDLDVGDDALSCTLSFQRRPYFCFIPWSAVYALVGEDQRGMVWPDDVPREVAAQAQKQQQVQERRSSMRAVPKEGDSSERMPASAAETHGTDGAAASPVPRLAEPPPDENPAEVAARESKQEPSQPKSAPPSAPPSSTQSPEEEPEGQKQGRRLPSYLRVVK